MQKSLKLNDSELERSIEREEIFQYIDKISEAYDGDRILDYNFVLDSYNYYRMQNPVEPKTYSKRKALLNLRGYYETNTMQGYK